MATIYCDPDGNPLASQPYASPQDELARLQAKNVALREIADGLLWDAVYYEDDVTKRCRHCVEYREDDFYKGGVHSPHAPACPVRRLEELS